MDPDDKSATLTTLLSDVLLELSKKPQSSSAAARDDLRELSEINRRFEEADKEARLRELRKKERKRRQQERKQQAAAEAAKQKAKWREKSCWRCKRTFQIHVDWKRPPTMCVVCAKELDSTYLPQRNRTVTMYTVQRIVQGGAPGLGKRK